MKQTAGQKPDRALPLRLPDLEEHEVFALRGLHRGDATPEQQVLAFDVIVKKLGNIGGMSYAGENTHDSAFGEGRRYIAFSLMRIITEPIERIVAKTSRKKEPRP